MKRSKFKGFTLLELIIVVAIFAIIMFSVVQLIDPVSKYFVRSSNFESTNACIDNMNRAIEGNLKYADRVRAYAYFNPGSVTTSGSLADLSTATYGHIEDFYNEFFKERGFMNCRGTIHVLIFENAIYGSDANNALLASKMTLSDYAADKCNSGKITHLSFDFDNYAGKVTFASGIDSTALNTFSGVFAKGKAETWYVNQKLYGNYDYRYLLGNSSIGFGGDETTTAATTTDTTATTTATTASSGGSSVSTTTALTPIVFDPKDFVIRIEASEIRKNPDGDGLIRLNPSGSTLASFTMKNVLDNTHTYSVALRDTVLKANYGIDAELSLTGDETKDKDKYHVAAQPARYAALQTGPDKPVDLTNTAGKFDGFYFIYTLPDECYNLDQYEAYSAFQNAFSQYIIDPSVSSSSTTTTATT